MERLILTYVITDGFTYSFTETVPVVHQGKQQALDEITLIMLQYEENDKNYKEKMAKLEKVISNLGHKLMELKEKNKNASFNKKIDALGLEYQEAIMNRRNHEKNKEETFMFGGNTFHYDYFISSDSEGKTYIELPQFFTLDEYFKVVEK